MKDAEMQDEAERVITMYIAPGTSLSIRPEDVIRGAGETDQAYAASQALAVELWSIPDNAGEALPCRDCGRSSVGKEDLPQAAASRPDIQK
jgi:hypothetical protein